VAVMPTEAITISLPKLGHYCGKTRDLIYEQTNHSRRRLRI